MVSVFIGVDFTRLTKYANMYYLQYGGGLGHLIFLLIVAFIYQCKKPSVVVYNVILWSEDMIVLNKGIVYSLPVTPGRWHV